MFLAIPAALCVGGCGGSVNRMQDVSVPDAKGEMIQPLAGVGNRPATVLLFITDDCPITNAFAPEINSIVTEYEPRGVAFYAVMVDPWLSPVEAQKYATDFNYKCPVLMDQQHELVKAVGAAVTPEVAVISATGEVVYRGRIDDRYVDFGKKRLDPGRRDLRIALDEVLAGERVTVSRAPAVGCYIPDAAEQSDE